MFQKFKNWAANSAEKRFNLKLLEKSLLSESLLYQKLFAIQNVVKLLVSLS